MKPSHLALLLLMFLFSCQNNDKEKNTAAVLNDSTSASGITGDSVKLVKTASLHLKVKDVMQSTRATSDLVRAFGGMVFDQSLESVETGRSELKVSDDSLLVVTTVAPQATITARIPSESLETFLYHVADLGYFTGSSNLHIDDKSLAYLENALKQKKRQVVLTQPPHRKATSGASLQTVYVMDDAIEQQIANKAIDADVRYSTVSLQLFQNGIVRKEVVANYDLSAYRLPFHHRLGNAFENGWQAFLTFLLALAHLWLFILVAAAVFFSYRYVQSKRNVQL